MLVTIFVNPIQFSDPKDFETYPRDEEGDLKKCESWGVDIALLPTVAEVYPHGKDAREKMNCGHLMLGESR